MLLVKVYGIEMRRKLKNKVKFQAAIIKFYYKTFAITMKLIRKPFFLNSSHWANVFQLWINTVSCSTSHLSARQGTELQGFSSTAKLWPGSTCSSLSQFLLKH